MITDPAVIEQLHARKWAAVSRYSADRRPSRFFRDYTQALDNALAKLWTALFGAESRLCLLAVGGYGRGEMYPYSDVDLAVVSPEPLDEDGQERIAALVQALWDAQLAPAVKSGSLNEICVSCAEDLTADTALLEARFLCGSRSFAEAVLYALNARRDTVAFMEAKLLEMRQRHGRQLAFPLEPDVKNGAGGLRDIHTMMWLAKAQGVQADFHALVRKKILTRDEADLLRDSHRRLARLRIDLHLAAGREEDRLLFDLQGTLAENVGLAEQGRQAGSERLMHIFYRTAKSVLQLNGILIPMLRGRVYSPLPRVVHEIDEHYYQVGSLLAARDVNLFKKQPEQIFAVVAMWQQRIDVEGLAPRTLRAWWAAVQQIDSAFYLNPANRERFLGFFRAGRGLTHIMRFLNLYGVLARYLPDWKNIVGLLQHDLFHIYPVDDHILTVLRNMRRMTIDVHAHELPFASGLMHSFEQKTVLYLAALFHDIAKGRNGDHAKLGVQDARRFAQSHKLSEHEADLLAWLVENHLLMSMVAQKQDIQDPAVVEKFCARVGSSERLTALYLLTVADIRGTNPKIWNSWKAQLLERLFQAAARHLAGSGHTAESVVGHRQAQAQRLLSEQGIDAKTVRRLWQDLGEAYFVRYDLASILWHVPLLAGNTDRAAAHIRLSPDSHTLQAWVFMPDGERLFTRLCRIFSRHRLDIVSARAYLTAHRYILDTFSCNLPEHADEAELPVIRAELQRELDDFLNGRFDDRPACGKASRRARLLPIVPHLSVQPEQERADWYTIELVAVNRPYLLADLTEVFARHNIRLAHANITTLAERAEDSFLIYAPDLVDVGRLLQLKQDLLKVL